MAAKKKVFDISSLPKKEQEKLAAEIGQKVNTDLVAVKKKLDRYLKKYGLSVKIGFEYAESEE